MATWWGISRYSIDIDAVEVVKETAQTLTVRERWGGKPIDKRVYKSGFDTYFATWAEAHAALLGSSAAARQWLQLRFATRQLRAGANRRDEAPGVSLKMATTAYRVFMAVKSATEPVGPAWLMKRLRLGRTAVANACGLLVGASKIKNVAPVSGRGHFAQYVTVEGATLAEESRGAKPTDEMRRKATEARRRRRAMMRDLEVPDVDDDGGDLPIRVAPCLLASALGYPGPAL